MANLVKANRPPVDSISLAFKVRTGKFELPSATGEEKTYVFCVKPNVFGVHNVTFGPFSLSTHTMDSGATLVKNRGNQYFPQLPSIILTDNQVDYIRGYLKTRIKVVPRRYVSGEWRDEEEVKFSDLVILCTDKEYDAAGYTLDLNLHKKKTEYENEIEKRKSEGLQMEDVEKIKTDLIETQMQEAQSKPERKKRK